MKRYRCTEAFLVPELDEDWNKTGKYRTVNIGDVYERSGETYFNEEVHFDGKDGWIEISHRMLDGCFEEIEDEGGVN